jgi:hypothetical protein
MLFCWATEKDRAIEKAYVFKNQIVDAVQKKKKEDCVSDLYIILRALWI